MEQYRQLTKDEGIRYGDITTQYPEEATQYRPEIILLSVVMEHLTSLR